MSTTTVFVFVTYTSWDDIHCLSLALSPCPVTVTTILVMPIPIAQKQTHVFHQLPNAVGSLPSLLSHDGWKQLPFQVLSQLVLHGVCDLCACINVHQSVQCPLSMQWNSQQYLAHAIWFLVIVSQPQPTGSPAQPSSKDKVHPLLLWICSPSEKSESAGTLTHRPSIFLSHHYHSDSHHITY